MQQVDQVEFLIMVLLFLKAEPLVVLVLTVMLVAVAVAMPQQELAARVAMDFQAAGVVLPIILVYVVLVVMELLQEVAVALDVLEQPQALVALVQLLLAVRLAYLKPLAVEQDF
jgi:hypothetical protein